MTNEPGSAPGQSTDDKSQNNSGSELKNNDSQNLNTTNVFRVSVKYSPFNRDDPEIWFTQLEAQFQLGGITVDGTKYGHLIAALDNETIKCVRDKVLNPPDNDKYQALKAAIISRLCDSAKIKLDRLLSGLQLGDKKPSQLLREMQALSVGQMNDTVLQNLWLQRLPTQTQQILSCMEDLNLDKLANAADKILEVHRPIDLCHISNSSLSQSSLHNSTTRELKSSIDALSKRFENFLVESRGRSNSKNRENSNSNNNRQRSKSRSEKQSKQYPSCWYHFKFGVNAQKCIKPCNFKTDEPKNY